MKKLLSKRLWLSVAHVAIIGGGVAGSLLFPPAGMAIMAGAAAVTALIPSPLSSTPKTAVTA